MRTRDTFDVMCSTAAVVADAVAVGCGFLLAVWLRFFAGWIPLRHERIPPLALYLYGAGVGTNVFVGQCRVFVDLSNIAHCRAFAPMSSHWPPAVF